jgi:hypothetical protein
MPREISREDWARFNEIQGYYKARGETLQAIAVTGTGYRIALYGEDPFDAAVECDDHGNITDIRPVTVGIPSVS